MPTLSPLKFHVCFIATSTDEKIRDLNMIAAHKKLPMKFFNLRDIAGTLHNTIEDGGTAEENADKKLKGVKDKINACRNDPIAIKQFCEAHGIAFDKDRIWFGTEDSGVLIPADIWAEIPEEAFKVLPDEVHERLNKQGEGMGVETAPFLSANLGAANLRALIETGIDKLKKMFQNQYKVENVLKYKLDHILGSFQEECVLKLESLETKPNPKPTPENPEEHIALHSFTADLKVINQYADCVFLHPDAITGLFSSYHFVQPVKSHNKDKRTAAEMGRSYIIKHSARAAAMDDIVNTIGHEVDTSFGPLKQYDRKGRNQWHDLITDVAVTPESFIVGMVNSGDDSAKFIEERLKYEGNHLKTYIPPSDEKPPEGASEVQQATFHLSAPERLLAKSDGLVLMPDSSNHTPMDLYQKLYMLQSIIVAKQLVPRDMAKPVVIINTDHSWDDAIYIHTQLANAKMTKDYSIPPSSPRQHLTSNGYFDVINGGEKAAAIKTAALLMKEKSLTYHRVKAIASETRKTGQPDCEDRRDMTAIFCSASSENAPLNGFIKEIARQLVADGQGLICGGGDRFTMGAILDGVRQCREDIQAKKPELSKAQIKEKTYIAGISTEPIAASETNTGQIPSDYNFRQLYPDIYERMAKMLVCSKKVIVAPGGAGTVQEWMGFHMLKNKMPELFKKKQLVIFDPELIDRSRDEDELKNIKNKVFDHIIHMVYPKQGHGFWLNRTFNRLGVQCVATIDEAITACKDIKLPKQHPSKWTNVRGALPSDRHDNRL